MALYWCSQPGCPGHDTFSASCPPPVIHDYPPLHSFLELLEAQPVEVPDTPQPARAAAAARASPTSSKSVYFEFWRE